MFSLCCDVINHVTSNFHTPERNKTPNVPAEGAERQAGLSLDEAKALAHPSRRRIAEALTRTPGGLTVSQLAEAVELHPNAVRQHLNVLAGAGVVVSAPSAPTGRRGRPSARYALAAPHGVAAAGHRELVRLLLELVRSSGMDAEAIERFGEEQGYNALGSTAQPGFEGLTATLAGLGFAPEEVTSTAGRRAGRMDVRLRSCPFKDAVLAEGGELICALHRGLVRGTLGRTAPDAELADFEIKGPVEAGCRALITGVDRTEPPPAD